MLTMAAFKLFLGGLVSKALALFEFVLKHWKVFLPLAIVLLGLWKINSLANERDAARDELTAYEEQVRVATEERKLENAKKETEYKTVVQIERDKHQAELDKLRGLYNAVKDKSTTLARTNVDLRNRLSRQLEEAITSNGLSGGFNRPFGLAESGGNSNTTGTGYGLEAYTNTLELACATTTSDYNTLYQRCAAVNKIFGR